MHRERTKRPWSPVAKKGNSVNIKKKKKITIRRPNIGAVAQRFCVLRHTRTYS